MKIPRQYVIDRLEAAAFTESKMPPTERKHFWIRSNWPDHITKYPDHEKGIRNVLKPSPRDISQMDEVVMQWLPWLSASRYKDPVALVKILWGKSQGYSFRELAVINKVPATTCRAWYCIGVDALIKKVNGRVLRNG